MKPFNLQDISRIFPLMASIQDLESLSMMAASRPNSKATEAAHKISKNIRHTQKKEKKKSQ